MNNLNSQQEIMKDAMTHDDPTEYFNSKKPSEKLTLP